MAHDWNHSVWESCLVQLCGQADSVVVKINDRGPYTRGRILDLSPRAADALDMKGVGVAAVVLEPLINQAGPDSRSVPDL